MLLGHPEARCSTSLCHYLVLWFALAFVGLSWFAIRFRSRALSALGGLIALCRLAYACLGHYLPFAAFSMLAIEYPPAGLWLNSLATFLGGHLPWAFEGLWLHMAI